MDNGLLSGAGEGCRVNQRDTSVNVGTGSDRGSAGVQTPVADLRAGRLRTRLGAADVALHLWRSKLLMFLVFLPIALLGVAASLMAPTTYSASTQLLVH